MRRGFTLIELSIVIVIIGLLIGGILVAQSLMASARNINLVKELRQYEIAINNFKINYNQYPGDSTIVPSPGDGNGALSGNERFRVFYHLYITKNSQKTTQQK